MWGLLRLPRFRGATHASGHDNRSRHCKVSLLQVHGVDAAGQVLIRRQLKRRAVLAFFQKLPVCLVGIEACASSHYWSRELQALGHSVRLMPPAYVKPYVKRQKNDMADAEAICEAVARANMRFVPTKTPESSCQHGAVHTTANPECPLSRRVLEGKRTCHGDSESDVHVESPGGISPPGAPK